MNVNWDNPHWAVIFLLSILVSAVVSNLISRHYASQGAKDAAELIRLQMLEMRAQEGGTDSYPYNRDATGKPIGISHNLSAFMSANSDMKAPGIVVKADGSIDAA